MKRINEPFAQASAPPEAKLLSNSLINLFGQLAPLFVALLTIPKLILGLGIDRFGILTLAWLVVGYFSLFDFGLGRALTQLIASRLYRDESGLRKTIHTALFLMAGLGVVGASIAVLLTPILVRSTFKIPEALIDESMASFLMLSLSIPIVIISAGLVGILTAYAKFSLINWVRIPLGISNYVIPVVALFYTNNLAIIIALLVVSRVLALAAYLMLCRYCMRNLSHGQDSVGRGIKSLLGFGGWMTVTNIVGPVMIYMDRFVIGGIISVAAVSYYATPFEIVTKLLIIPSSIVGVLFPALAIASQNIDRKPLIDLFDDSWRYIALTVFPCILVIVAFSREGLTFWIGEAFAKESGQVLQLLAFGVLFNALAHVPFTLIQSAGRPDITAKLHLLELCVYLPCLLLALRTFGIVGAAAVWTLRVIADGGLLSIMSIKLMPETRKSFTDIMMFSLAAGIALAILICLASIEARGAAFIGVIILFIISIYKYGLIPSHLKSMVASLALATQKRRAS